MKEVKINGGIEIKFYDSIKELPILRYHEFQKAALQDSGIGSDMTAVSAHLSLLHKFLNADKKGQAMRETINLHNNLFFMLEGVNIKSFCFAAMIFSINGKPLNDISEENVKRVIKHLSKNGLTIGLVEDTVEEIKKKLISNFDPSFLVDTPAPEMLILSGKSKEKSAPNSPT